jgi:hypothetical protein
MTGKAPDSPPPSPLVLPVTSGTSTTPGKETLTSDTSDYKATRPTGDDTLPVAAVTVAVWTTVRAGSQWKVRVTSDATPVELEETLTRAVAAFRRLEDELREPK